MWSQLLSLSRDRAAHGRRSRFIFRRSRRRGNIWPTYLMTRTAATPRDTAKANSAALAR